jgi:hypothetical protein
LVILLWAAAPALARAQRTAVPRTTDLAVQENGLCGQAVFDPSRTYLSTVDEADAMLVRPPADALEALFRVRIPDLTNGTERAHGDYAEDIAMPFSAAGTPTGPGERLAIRLWGELRIERAGFYTLGIRTDDGYRLLVGDEVVSEHVRVRLPRIDTMPIWFPSPGLYPVELVYFENLVDALIELSVLEGEAPEVTDADAFPSPGFVLIPTSMLAVPPEGCSPRGRVMVDGGVADAGVVDGGAGPALYLHGNGACSVSHSHGRDALAPWLFLMLASFLARRRRQIEQRAHGLLVVLALTVVPSGLEAQSVASLERFVPSTGVLGAPTVAGAPEERGVSVSALIDHARSPLGRTDDAGARLDVVRSQTVLRVALEVPVVPELRLAAVVPATVAIEGQRDPQSGAEPGGAGLGDIRLGARARLAALVPELVLSASAYLAIPTPASSTWTASTEVGANGELSLTLSLAPVRAVLSLGARYRSGQRLLNLRPGPEALGGLAVEVSLLPELSIGAELVMATALDERFGADETNAAELGLFGRLALHEGFRALLGGSLGLGQAYGVPEARVFVGVGWDITLDRSSPPSQQGQEAAR